MAQPRDEYHSQGAAFHKARATEHHQGYLNTWGHENDPAQRAASSMHQTLRDQHNRLLDLHRKAGKAHQEKDHATYKVIGEQGKAQTKVLNDAYDRWKQPRGPGLTEYKPPETAMTIDLAKLNDMLKMEKAAADWWSDMTEGEKKAYLTGHPGSKMGGHVPAPEAHAAPDHIVEHHADSAAFHRGRAAFHKQAAKSGDVEKDRLHNGLSFDHNQARVAHARAREAAKSGKKQAFRKHLADATYEKDLARRYEQNGMPTGHGHTSYDSKAE